jgi:hypothetical protein
MAQRSAGASMAKILRCVKDEVSGQRIGIYDRSHCKASRRRKGDPMKDFAAF